MNAPDISIVSPVFNEEENVGPLVEELVGVLCPMRRSYEVIFVDDGSTDGSHAKLRELQKEHPEIRLLRHRVNSGESASELTGFRHARGQIIITIDSDLQNDPHDIPAMLKMLETCDVVCGRRNKREDSWLKRISSRVANKVRNALLHDQIHDAGCTYRAIRRAAIEIELIPFKGLHRFLPTIWKTHGFRVKEIAVNHRPRFKGQSKYGLWNRLGVGILDIFAIRWYRRRHITAPRLSESDSDLAD
jgi:glycosyltransferase involved in cell wall biosynthesis